MTLNDLKTLDFVRSTIERSGIAPTIREIMATLGHASPQSAVSIVRRLCEEGHLIRLPGRRDRNISLPNMPDLRVATTVALKRELQRREKAGG